MPHTAFSWLAAVPTSAAPAAGWNACIILLPTAASSSLCWRPLLPDERRAELRDPMCGLVWGELAFYVHSTDLTTARHKSYNYAVSLFTTSVLTELLMQKMLHAYIQECIMQVFITYWCRRCSIYTAVSSIHSGVCNTICIHGIFPDVKFCVAVQLVGSLGKAAKFTNLYDIGESNPVLASGLWSRSGSKFNQFVHVPTSVDT